MRAGHRLSRRAFLGAGAATATTFTLGSAFWQRAFADVAVDGPGNYGALGEMDAATGLQLPAGFRSRIIAVAGDDVARDDGQATGYPWHVDPDGGAVFDTDDGGWVYVSNSEDTPGGAGAIRFDRNGDIVDAYRILDGTRNNCAGGPTPWGTWLSCEEADHGLVWECEVQPGRVATVLPALGAFVHEAVAVDPVGQWLYLTEDSPTGRLYRFTPAAYPDLTAGTLEAAAIETPVPDDRDQTRTWRSRLQWTLVSPDDPAAEQDVADRTTVFEGGEGIWYDAGHVYFTTKGDGRVWDLDARRQELTLLYDDSFWPEGDAPLTGADNVTVSPAGEIFLAEDGPTPAEIAVIAEVDGQRQVTPFARVADHDETELAGPAFSSDGTRLYFSSQRGPSAVGERRGITYEVTGPFTPPRPPSTMAPLLPAIGGGTVARGAAASGKLS